MIGALIGLLIGLADYGFIYKMVAAAKARNGGTIGAGMKIALFVTSVVAFTIVGWWVGTQLEAGNLL